MRHPARQSLSPPGGVAVDAGACDPSAVSDASPLPRCGLAVSGPLTVNSMTPATFCCSRQGLVHVCV